MMRVWHFRGFWILVGMVFLFGLAACSGDGSSQPPQQAAPTTSVGAGELETIIASPSSLATQVPGVAGATIESPTTAASTEAPTQALTEASQQPAIESASPPPVREGLHATDPSTVQLASGKVQLVEFFAFW